MERYGIKTWGGQITGGEFFFSVKLEQAQWAEYLLNQRGVPIAPFSQGAPPPKYRSRKSSSDSLLDKHLDSDTPPFFLF